MGLTVATLNGHRVTSARATIPAWGRWYADASVDGEVTLTGAVTLKIADLTLAGTVLSGGPSKGRSHYRIVAGAGGWGKTIPAASYTNDAGTKLTKVLGDAAKLVGETIDTTSAASVRVGPGWTTQAGPASRLLEQLAPAAWYVGEDGVTRIGRRQATVYSGKATLGPVDHARGTVTLAAESIASIVPGVQVDGIEAIDVQHEISKDGLRSTIWGKTAASKSRRLDAFRGIFDQLDPNRAFRGLTEYRVIEVNGERLDVEPVRVSTGMPVLRRVLARPGVPGCFGEPALLSRVLVAFANSEPGRPLVVAFEDAEGDGFQPTALSLLAGGMAGTEHVMTLESTVVLIHNVFAALGTAMTIPWAGATVQAALAAAINSALAAQAAPAPQTEAAQIAAAIPLAATMLTGQLGSTVAPYSAAIAALSTKTSNDSGLFPSLGSKAVKTG